ncbi:MULTISPECIES: CDP-alcohol phosphatidyltransferase family protein [unclassified Treponema]|uniref:CDP-alcohol phosphatidyltransferase family protein n=1 Tax=unclassified Treponema TaxID=2638727 RepID=UPI0005301178|nr:MULTISPECIES: CDP-alcohol phosphatidyltransferase family protein [unclassified Treponema]AIW90229.1 CDP-alcohol phosphatidyltransferase [Treponema sp. OMZ 838]UTC49729.1 CDP-alcohol phosphatidyltransferase family protein [Treponema sp. OMZ 855]
MYTTGKKYAAFVLINCLTLSRIPLSVFAYMEITAGTIRGIYYLCLFLGIAVSDFLDGKCARAFHVQSGIGAIADVICDFFYIMTSTYALYRLGCLPIWVLILITVKLFEFILTSLLIKRVQYRSHIFMFDRIGRYTAIGFYILPTVIVLCSIYLMPFFFIIRYVFCVSLLIFSLVSTYLRCTVLVKTNRIHPAK